MSVHFSVGGVKCALHLDWLAFSVHGMKSIPPNFYKYLPELKFCGQCATHHQLHRGDGVVLKSWTREGCRNAPMEITLSGKYFSGGWPLDALLNCLYTVGGWIKPFRVDFALDYYGAVDEFMPEFLDQYSCNFQNYHKGKEKIWTGFAFGKNDRRWKFYNKWFEQVYEHGVKPGELPSDWWRAELTLRGDYCRALGIGGHAFERDFDSLAPQAMRGTRVFSIPWLNSILTDLQSGNLSFYIKNQVTFEGAYRALYDDVTRKIRRFYDKHLKNIRDADFSVFAGAFATDLFDGAVRGSKYQPIGGVRLGGLVGDSDDDFEDFGETDSPLSSNRGGVVEDDTPPEQNEIPW